MILGLQNKRVLVSGSSKGIGLAIAKGFLYEAAKVVLSSRNQNELDHCKEKLLKDNPSSQILAISCDFTQVEEVQKIKETIVKQWGGLDIVVVNVGSGKSVLDPIPSAENFEHVFSLNFDSAVYTAREFYPLLKSSRGNLIFISSIAGLEAFGAPVDYAVAKTAIIAFAKNLARKVAADGVRVNCIAPGNIYFEGGSWDEK
jgi:3-oxoacyl-[acyl-carrier protein] reductase